MSEEWCEQMLQNTCFIRKLQVFSGPRFAPDITVLNTNTSPLAKD